MSDAAATSSAPAAPSASVNVPDAPVSFDAPVSQDQALADAGIDDAQLMREAMEMARGKEPEAREEPKQTEAPSEKAEAKQETEADAKKPDQPDSQEWAKFYSRVQELEAREGKLKEREAAASDFEAAKSSGDIEKALALLGYNDAKQFLSDIAEYGGKPSRERSEIAEMRKQVAELKAERERETQAKRQQEQVAAQQRAVAEKKSEIKNFIQGKFKDGLVGLDNGPEEVFAVMQRHYQATKAKTGRGEEMSLAKAVEQVEKNWETQLEKIAANPKAREVFQRIIGGSAPASPKSTPKGSPVSAVKAAPAQDASYDGEKELNEALSWMRARDRARRA